MLELQPNILINVFQFPLLSKDECAQTRELILKNKDCPQNGSMQKHTVDMIKSCDIIQQHMPTIISKINHLYDFDKKINYSLYAAHAVMYNASNGEKALALHKDDSDITVNILIHTENLIGSELRFMGSTPYGNTECKKHFEKNRVKHPLAINTVSQEVGSCIIHRGDHPHETSAIYNGERISVILWLKKTNNEDIT